MSAEDIAERIVHEGHLTRTQIEEIKRVFKAADKDGSGALTADEIDIMLNKLTESRTSAGASAMQDTPSLGLGLSSLSAGEFLRRLDKDGNGRVDWREFVYTVAEWLCERRATGAGGAGGMDRQQSTRGSLLVSPGGARGSEGRSQLHRDIANCLLTFSSADPQRDATKPLFGFGGQTNQSRFSTGLHRSGPATAFRGQGLGERASGPLLCWSHDCEFQEVADPALTSQRLQFTLETVGNEGGARLQQAVGSIARAGVVLQQQQLGAGAVGTGVEGLDLSVLDFSVSLLLDSLCILDTLKTPDERVLASGAIAVLFECMLTGDSGGTGASSAAAGLMSMSGLSTQFVGGLVRLAALDSNPQLQWRTLSLLSFVAGGPRVADAPHSSLLYPPNAHVCQDLLVHAGALPLLTRILTGETASPFFDVELRAVNMVGWLCKGSPRHRDLIVSFGLVPVLTAKVQAASSLTPEQLLALRRALSFSLAIIAGHPPEFAIVPEPSPLLENHEVLPGLRAALAALFLSAKDSGDPVAATNALCGLAACLGGAVPEPHNVQLWSSIVEAVHAEDPRVQRAALTCIFESLLSHPVTQVQAFFPVGLLPSLVRFLGACSSAAALPSRARRPSRSDALSLSAEEKLRRKRLVHKHLAQTTALDILGIVGTLFKEEERVAGGGEVPASPLTSDHGGRGRFDLQEFYNAATTIASVDSLRNCLVACMLKFSGSSRLASQRPVQSMLSSLASLLPLCTEEDPVLSALYGRDGALVIDFVLLADLLMCIANLVRAPGAGDFVGAALVRHLMTSMRHVLSAPDNLLTWRGGDLDGPLSAYYEHVVGCLVAVEDLDRDVIRSLEELGQTSLPELRAKEMRAAAADSSDLVDTSETPVDILVLDLDPRGAYPNGTNKTIRSYYAVSLIEVRYLIEQMYGRSPLDIRWIPVPPAVISKSAVGSTPTPQSPFLPNSVVSPNTYAPPSPLLINDQETWFKIKRQIKFSPPPFFATHRSTLGGAPPAPLGLPALHAGGAESLYLHLNAAHVVNTQTMRAQAEGTNPVLAQNRILLGVSNLSCNTTVAFQLPNAAPVRNPFAPQGTTQPQPSVFGSTQGVQARWGLTAGTPHQAAMGSVFGPPQQQQQQQTPLYALRNAFNSAAAAGTTVAKLLDTAARLVVQHTGADGMVSRDGVVRIFASLGVQDPSAVDHALTLFDTACTGMVDRRELTVGLAVLIGSQQHSAASMQAGGVQTSVEERLLLAFKAFDTNDNEFIDPPELYNLVKYSLRVKGVQTAPGEIDSMVNLIMQHADQVRDGRLSFAEFKRAIFLGLLPANPFWDSPGT